LTPDQISKLISRLSASEREYLFYDWQIWARTKQLPPEGDWHIWLLLAGRGFGKTRAGAEWVRSRAMADGDARIGLVGETWDDVRSVMVEGTSGILAVSPADQLPRWLPSRRRLEWPSGAVGHLYAADRPDQLRGPEFDTVWADELAKWRYPLAWDNLLLAARRGKNPKILATTTPRPRKWLKQLSEQPDCVLVTGRTAENQACLAPGFADRVRRQLASDSLARQELDGVLTLAPEDSLWQYQQLDSLIAPPPPLSEFGQIVVGVDPALGGTDETCIIVAGRHQDNLIWVLEDASTASPPHLWIAEVVRQAEKYRAQAIIAEVNQGGALISHLLEKTQTRRPVPVRAARAIASKTGRALPVAASYQRQEIRHAGYFDRLVDQMVNFSPGLKGQPSPDRLDALVWAVTALIKGIRTTQNEFRL